VLRDATAWTVHIEPLTRSFGKILIDDHLCLYLRPNNFAILEAKNALTCIYSLRFQLDLSCCSLADACSRSLDKGSSNIVRVLKFGRFFIVNPHDFPRLLFYHWSIRCLSPIELLKRAGTVCKSDVISAVCQASSKKNGPHIGQSSTDFVFATLIRRYTRGYVSYVLLHRTDQSMRSMQNIPVPVVGFVADAYAPRVVVPHGAQLGLLRPIAPVAPLAPSRDLLRSCFSPARANGSHEFLAVLPLPSEQIFAWSRVAWAEVCSTVLILFGPFGHELLLLTHSILRFGITYALIVTCSAIRIFAPEEQEVKSTVEYLKITNGTTAYKVAPPNIRS